MQNKKTHNLPPGLLGFCQYGACKPCKLKEIKMREQTTGSDWQGARPPEPEFANPTKPKPVAKTKTDVLRKLLLRPKGATVVQIQNCLIWQPHTVRAAISRLRKPGVVIELDQSSKVARYRAMPREVSNFACRCPIGYW